MQINAYLGFDGQCEEAFRFYADTLKGRIAALFRFGETPAAEHVPAEAKDRIMHVRLEVGNAVLMGSDSPPGRHEGTRGMYVSLNLEDPTEAERIFNAFATGGAIQMPIEETFWALRFGMVTDRFGTPWMINCEKRA